MYRFATMLACVVGVASGNAVHAAPKSEDNVKITIKADKPADGKQVVTLTLEVAKEWHLYANPVMNDDLVTSQTTIDFTVGGKPTKAKVEYPEGKLIKDTVVGNYRTYEGTVTIKATIDRAGDGPVEAIIAIQTCTDKKCLLQSIVKRKVD